MIWIALGMGICGLLLSAFFSGAETGFYRATRLRLVLDAMAGDRVARGLLFLTNHPALFVATALVGNSVANYSISLATVIAMGRMLPLVPEAAEIIASIVSAPIVLIYGELLPKNLFLHAPNRLLRRGGALFLFFVMLFFPLAGLLWVLGRLLARLTRTSQEPIRLVLAQRSCGKSWPKGTRPASCTPPSRAWPTVSWRSPASRCGSFSRRRGRWSRSGPTRASTLRWSGPTQPHGRYSRGRRLRPAGGLRAGRRFESARRRRPGPHSAHARGSRRQFSLDRADASGEQRRQSRPGRGRPR